MEQEHTKESSGRLPLAIGVVVGIILQLVAGFAWSISWGFITFIVWISTGRIGYTSQRPAHTLALEDVFFWAGWALVQFGIVIGTGYLAKWISGGQRRAFLAALLVGLLLMAALFIWAFLHY